MKVVLAGSALAGIRPRETTAIAERSWTARRPSDSVTALPVSDGISMPLVGSGIDDALSAPACDSIERGKPDVRRFALVAGDRFIFDYTTLYSGIPDTSVAIPAEPMPELPTANSSVSCENPRSSSAMIGEDLAWAAKQGARDVVVVLPVPCSITDGGQGLIGALSNNRSGDLEEEIRIARQQLSDMRLTVLAPREQRLLGLSGVARQWMNGGMEPGTAQTYERQLGQWVSELHSIEPPNRASLMKAQASSRGIYAGVGSGVAYVLQILGAGVFPVGDATVLARLAEPIKDADLVVYICGDIDENLPSGLLSAISLAQGEGVPVVVVYDSGGLRKGELPNLGLNGAYELRPDRSFNDEPNKADVGTLENVLANMVARVARTWGWD